MLKQLYQTLGRRLKQIASLPRVIAAALERARLQTLLDQHEAERLDRIRNPSKYRGK